MGADLASGDGGGLLSWRDDDHAAALRLERAPRGLEERGLACAGGSDHGDEPVGAGDTGGGGCLSVVERGAVELGVDGGGEVFVGQRGAGAMKGVEEVAEVGLGPGGGGGHELLDVPGHRGLLVVGQEGDDAGAGQGALGHVFDELVEDGAVGHDPGLRDGAADTGLDVVPGEAATAPVGAGVRIADGRVREDVTVSGGHGDRVGVGRAGGRVVGRGQGVAGAERGGVDGRDLGADGVRPLGLVDLAGLVGAAVCPCPPVDHVEHALVRLAARVLLAPLGQACGAVRFDLVRPARQWPDKVLQFGDLAVLGQGVALGRESGHPLGVGAGGQVAFAVDDVLELHGHAGVDVRPAAIGTLDLDVQPEVAVLVGVEGP